MYPFVPPFNSLLSIKRKGNISLYILCKRILKNKIISEHFLQLFHLLKEFTFFLNHTNYFKIIKIKILMISWFEKHNKTSWGITILGAISIFYISSLVFPTEKVQTNLLAITYHISAFFLLTLFLLISSIQGKKIKLIPIPMILLILYGILDELHQYFIPGRDFSLLDIFLDTTGILMASMFYFILILLKNNPKTLKKL